jgi:hypothetical protein
VKVIPAKQCCTRAGLSCFFGRHKNDRTSLSQNACDKHDITLSIVPRKMGSREEEIAGPISARISLQKTSRVKNCPCLLLLLRPLHRALTTALTPDHTGRNPRYETQGVMGPANGKITSRVIEKSAPIACYRFFARPPTQSEKSIGLPHQPTAAARMSKSSINERLMEYRPLARYNAAERRSAASVTFSFRKFVPGESRGFPIGSRHSAGQKKSGFSGRMVGCVRGRGNGHTRCACS